MERGRVFRAGAGGPGLLTLEGFRAAFERAMAAPGGGRGDHDLNPGMEPPRERRPASVLIPVVGREAEPTILLTQRADDLPHHPGQVSFPGGRVEAGDRDAVETALRETEEEIGLDRSHVEVIGRLDDYVTRTGFVVTPVVGLVRPPFETEADPVEVAAIFEVPLSFVLDRSNHERHSREWRNRMRHFYVFPHPERYIWGATAGMLVNLADLLLGAAGE